MTLPEGSLPFRRLRAPRDDGGLLIEPPLRQVAELLEENARRRAEWEVDLLDRSLSSLARDARRQLIEHAARYTRSYRDVDLPELSASGEPVPVLLAGHQPELFHPGVWIKNFVLDHLAREHAAVAVNLVIDNDTCRTASIRVPGGSVAEPTVESIPYDAPDLEIPHEQRRVIDPVLLAGFGERAVQRIAPLVSNPLVGDLWPLVVRRLRETGNLGECLAQGRHQLEGRWGLQTLEIPQSQVAQIPAFHWFTAHLLAHLPRLWDVYNASLGEFRRASRVRSSAHPVPDLGSEGEWLEAPFWLYSNADPRRRAVFARQNGERVDVSDLGDVNLRLRLGPDAAGRMAVDQLAELPSRGIKLRPRALLTTMFARLLLGEAFLHGIGGAKYDQLTDWIIARFFGIRPPRHLVFSATLHLPVPHVPAAPDALQQVDHTLRELIHHPERHLEAANVGPDTAERIATKRRWVTREQTRENAQQRCREIRRVNAELQPLVAAKRECLLRRREEIARAVRVQSILASREYAFCLYPEKTLRALVLATLPQNA